MHVRRKAPQGTPLPITTPVAAIFIMLGVLATLFQLTDFVDATLLGLPIPDTVIYSRTLTFWQGGRALFNERNYILGITILYGWTWAITPVFCILVNIALLLLALRFTKFFERPQDGYNFAQFGILLNGYIILALPGPNKEIPLITATLIYLTLLRSGALISLVTAAALGAACVALRDGYGAFMVIWALSRFALRSERARAAYAVLGCALVALAQPMLMHLKIFARNVNVAQAISENHSAVGGIASQLPFSADNPIGAVILFTVRLIYNWSYLAVNPILFTSDGTIYAIGWAYWTVGLLIIVIIPVAIWNLVRSRDELCLQQAAFIVGTWAVVSLSLYVQPRYLIPILPSGLAIFMQAPVKVRRYAIISGMMMVAFFVLLHVFTGKTESARPDKYDRKDYYQRA